MCKIQQQFFNQTLVIKSAFVLRFPARTQSPKTLATMCEPPLRLDLAAISTLKSAGKRMTKRQFFTSFAAPKLVTGDLSPVHIWNYMLIGLALF